MKLKKMNKRGDATDPLVLLIILTFLAISFVVVIFINTKISTVISTSALNQTNVTSQTIIPTFTMINTVAVQRAFVAMFAFMVIFILLSGFLIRVHPAFLFLYIFSLGTTLLTAVFVGNLCHRLRDNAELATVLAQQVQMSFIMENIVAIITAVGFLSIIIVFTKLFSAPVGGNTSDL